MPYKVTLSPVASAQLGRLRGVQRVALRGVVLALARDPRPRGAAKSAGKRGLWRLNIRVDGHPWRVIYVLDEPHREVRVTLLLSREAGRFEAP